MVIRSRCGTAQMVAMIRGIAKGRIFIPFHYGYLDSPNDVARAANELTQGECRSKVVKMEY